MFKVVVRATEIVHDILRRNLKDDDIVVDATLGNGRDTMFLKDIVTGGRVYSFEIQKCAVDNFKRQIDSDDIKNIVLINDGHENIDKYVFEKPKAITFNLGYLPGGDKTITTLPNSTIEAMQKGLYMLAPGGIMSLEVYRGHEGGEDEADKVVELVRGLDSRNFSVMEINFTNKSSSAPFLIIIEKNDRYCEGI